MHATLQAQAMIRCKAITKAGKQCSVTSNSSWINNDGRVVAEPLRRGGEFCALHSKPFCTKVIKVDDIDRLLIFILDLESLRLRQFKRMAMHG